MPAKVHINQTVVNASAFVDALRCGHRLAKRGKGYKCENCLVYRGPKKFSFWSHNTCRPSPSAGMVLKRRFSSFGPNTGPDHDSGPANKLSATSANTVDTGLRLESCGAT